ncbi:MAG: alpha/beta hydrolase family protein [Planctomycetes bacterium]|nr:alpha/beta hydrolase family protein [Planctomycetota bacterium]
MAFSNVSFVARLANVLVHVSCAACLCPAQRTSTGEPPAHPVERVLLDEYESAYLEQVGGSNPASRILHVEGTLEERVERFGALLRDDLVRMARVAEREHPELRLPGRWFDERGTLGRRLLDILSRSSRVPRSALERLVARRLQDASAPFPELDVVCRARGGEVSLLHGYVPGVNMPELFLVDPERAEAVAVDSRLAQPLTREHLATDNGATGREEIRRVERGHVEVQAPPRRSARTDEDARWLAPYTQEHDAFAYRLEIIEEGESGQVANLRLPSAIETGSRLNDIVFGRWYRGSRERARHPAVILLHHLENRFWLEESIANDLRKRGIDVVLMHLPWYGRRRPGLFDERRAFLGGTEALMRFGVQAHADVQRIRRFLLSQSEISSVGLVGISLGGIVTAVIGGVEGTFDDLVPVLAGGPPQLVLREGEREAKSVRRAFERAGIDAERDAEALRPLDPVAFAGRVDPRTVLMINAEDDTVIPRAATVCLWEAFSKPELVYFPGTHITVAFQMPRILEALQRHLERDR